MQRRPAVAIVNRLPVHLRRHGISWSELARRTLLPPELLCRLRGARANPPLAIAEQVAAALDVPIERLWRLTSSRAR